MVLSFDKILAKNVYVRQVKSTYVSNMSVSCFFSYFYSVNDNVSRLILDKRVIDVNNS